MQPLSIAQVLWTRSGRRSTLAEGVQKIDKHRAVGLVGQLQVVH